MSSFDEDVRKIVKRVEGTPDEPPDTFGEVVLRVAKVGIVLFALVTLYVVGPTIVGALIRATHEWHALFR
jgi:hypothetical protein